VVDGHRATPRCRAYSIPHGAPVGVIFRRETHKRGGGSHRDNVAAVTGGELHDALAILLCQDEQAQGLSLRGAGLGS
jgi:hypothetical protein